MTNSKSFWEDDIPKEPVSVKSAVAPKAAKATASKRPNYIRAYENPDLVSPSQLQLRELCDDRWSRGSVFKHDSRNGETVDERYKRLLDESAPDADRPDPDIVPVDPDPDEWIARSRNVNGITITTHVRRGDIRHDHRARGNALGAAFRRLGSP